MDTSLINRIVIKPGLSLHQLDSVMVFVAREYEHPYNCAFAMPMGFFARNEPEIRRWMHANTRRAFYRGPRISNKLKNTISKASMTRRCDAVAVVMGIK